MASVLLSFWVIIFCILAGYLLARAGVVAPGTDRTLTQIAFNSTLPALLFMTVAESEPAAFFSRGSLANVLSASLIAILYWALGRYMLGIRGTKLTIGTLAACYTNVGNLGIALLVAITQDASTAAPILLFQIGVLVPVFFAILDRQTGQPGRGLWHTVISRLRNPLLLAVLCGLVFSLAGWQVPAVIAAPANMLGQANVPIILIAMGISIRGARVPKFDRESWALILAVFMRCILGPLTVFLLGWSMGVTGHTLLSITIVGAFPTANNVFVYAHRYQSDVALARDAVLITTGLCLVVMLAIATMFHAVGIV